MRILITGGAGFIGGNFVQYMLGKYHQYEIVNLDLLTYAGELSKHEHIQRQENYSFIQADIADRETIMSVFHSKQFDVVVHFAAESHVDRSITDPGIFVRTNVLGTQVLLDAAKAFGVSKFVHISTDEVYGDLEFDSTIFFTEETPIQPNSPYSASKAGSDLLVRAYYETYGMNVNITRCSNNYGPYHFPEKLIPLTISRVVKDEKISVYGNGSNVRDWLHVYDHCTAIDLVLHEGEKGQVYNVGGHNERTNLEVVKTIINALGKSEDLIEYVTDRLGHDKRYAIDPTKLEVLGWKPTYTFETGIAQTIDWYISHKDWWERILHKG
jgi:dTDP-glucose 4,6-dehydratase